MSPFAPLRLPVVSALSSNRARLLILAMLHFAVDFYAGLCKPLPEPTLVEHLGAGLGDIMLLLGAAVIVINAVQPISGALLPRRGCPALLAICPLLACVVCAVGFTQSYALAAVLLIVSGIGVGLLHPEAMLAAHAMSGSRQGLGLSIYISGGFFGFSFGNWVGAAWVSEWGFLGFWLLALPALAAPLLVAASGLGRIEGHLDAPLPKGNRHSIPFWVILILAAGIAVNLDVVTFYFTPYLVRQFGREAQAWGGATLLTFGVAGSLASFLWGWLSERWGCLRVIAFTQLCAIPLLYSLIHVSEPRVAPLCGAAFGFFAAGVIPLAFVLARGAPGPASRLRAGIIVGGAFGSAAVVAMALGKWIDRFPADQAEPIARVIHIGFFLLAGIAVFAACLSRFERPRPGPS